MAKAERVCRANLRVGGKYRWKGQSEQLVYLGRSLPGNGSKHQFALVEKPNVVCCETVNKNLHFLEELE